jgi:hypothetical protein
VTSTARKATAAADVEVAADPDQELKDHIAEHEAEFAGKPEHGTILYNWGAYPFYGLLGTTILSKEMFILDDNFPAVLMFGSVFLFFTWMGGPALGKHYKDTILAEEQKKHDDFDLIFALMDRTTDQMKAFNKQPAVLKEYLEEYKASVTEVAEADVRRLQLEAYQATMTQLQTIATQKAAEGAAQANIADDVMMAFLGQAFNDAKLIDATVEEAIDGISGTSKPVADGEAGSIVEGIFQEYISSGQFDYERIQAMENAKAAAAEQKS